MLTLTIDSEESGFRRVCGGDVRPVVPTNTTYRCRHFLDRTGQHHRRARRSRFGGVKPYLQSAASSVIEPTTERRAPVTMREAVIHIPYTEYEKVGLGDLVSTVREAGLRDITELVCERGGCIVVITVEDPVDEAALSTTNAVTWWERLSGHADGVVYLCKINSPAPDDATRPMATPGISSEEINVDDHGMDVALVGTHEDIARGIDGYVDAGMNVLLERIGDYSGPRTALDALTERQREILETAYGLGYFDVPRSVSLAAVAAEIDLDPSTVAEHLQRAERNLITRLLAPP